MGRLPRKPGKKDPGKAGPPPRTDLRLEALAQILDGTIKIHSHCYRSDEILMLLRTAERHGVRVQSLQHVLEGYKVAAEIAEHGASASTFSDWWAYKVEAYDAIPFNAALLTEAGVNVCIKSDSEELMRHLNLEAAKMVKYGGVSEAQALAMITLNPARELGLEHRLGSIEVGKDARSSSLFNAHPFDAFSRCELALIDGEVYFQRPEPDGKFGVRPGDHSKMPHGARGRAEPRGRVHRPSRRASSRWSARPLHPVSGPVDPQRHASSSRAARSRRSARRARRCRPEAQTIELGGLDVWPGLVDAGSTIGLSEIGSLPETQDFADASRFEPELRASTALRPDSEHIPVTRANGVLTAYVQPTGGLISGQGCVIDLRGWVPAGAGHRRSRRAQREHPHLRRPRPRQPASRSRTRSWAGRRRGWPGPAGSAERAARGDSGAVPQGARGTATWWPRPVQGRGAPAPRSSPGRAGPLCEGPAAGDLPGRQSHRDPRRAWRSPRS